MIVGVFDVGGVSACLRESSRWCMGVVSERGGSGVGGSVRMLVQCRT